MTDYLITAYNGEEARCSKVGGESPNLEEAMKSTIQNIGAHFNKSFYDGLRLEITLHRLHNDDKNRLKEVWHF